MSYIVAVVLGVVQGVAEFLPISSSGHLTLFQHFLGMPEPDNLFNILLHFATLIAVCVYYWRDIWEMILEFFRFFGDSVLPHAQPGRAPRRPAADPAADCGHPAPVPGAAHQELCGGRWATTRRR